MFTDWSPSLSKLQILRSFGWPMGMNYHFTKVCGEATSDELPGRRRQGDL